MTMQLKQSLPLFQTIGLSANSTAADVRSIAFKGHILLGISYFAVRDADWGTIQNKIQNLEFEDKTNGIHISPITLRRRNDSDPTTVVSIEKQRIGRLDPRHSKVFRTLWVQGCLKNLAQSRASHLTFYQTQGQEEVPMSNPKTGKKTIAQVCIKYFQFFDLFKAIGMYRNAKIFLMSSCPLKFEDMILKKVQSKIGLLVNYCQQEITVTLADKICLEA